jgi:hypothetical protein
MRASVVLLIGLGLLLLPACGSDGDESSGSATSPAATAAESSPNGVVPEELQATWRLESDTIEEPVRLSLRDASYSISRGGASGSGTIAVEGDELVFSDSNLCDGVGRYRWTLDGERLSLERLEEACSGRAPVLEGATYTRSG